MWVKDGQVFVSHADVRRASKRFSFPRVMTDEVISSAGFTKVTTAPTPDHNPLTHVAEYTIADNAQVWTTREKTADELAAMRAGMKISMRQARLALLGAGLLSQVDAAIAAMDEPAKSAIDIEWEYAHVVDRTSPWMGAMAQALGITDTELDALFATAATL